MRVVAKFQFVARELPPNSADRITEILDAWCGQKFEYKADGSAVIRVSGIAAQFDRRDEKLDHLRRLTFLLVEPIRDGLLQTEIGVLSSDSDVRFQCRLSLSSEGGLRLPVIELRSPRFIRQIIELGLAWRIGTTGERIFAKCFDVAEGDIEEFDLLLTAPERRLPIIAVSELQGGTLAGDLHERISADTCGLAHTCRLSREASWRLTDKRGKEWSCYNGAVRLFWPLRANRDDPRAHPLWTYDYLMRRGDDEFAARDRFRREIAEQLFGASTFVVDDSAFAQFDTEKSRKLRDATKATATESGDFKLLAELYASENDQLRASLEAKARDIETLQQNIEALTIALRSRQVEAAQENRLEAPPQSVTEAVDNARKNLNGTIEFSDSIDQQVATLNPAAGPPEKVGRYLHALADLAAALSSRQPLGKSIPIWLREKGVECSGESETVKANREARRRRTFNFGGEQLYCEYHAKPTEGVAPDLCVRIYFAISDAPPYVRVGYVGRHFD